MSLVDTQTAITHAATGVIPFGQTFLPKTFRMASPAFHYEMDALLMSPLRYVAFEIFRESAKTTLCRTFSLMRTVFGLSNTILFVSASESYAANSLGWIRRHIEMNPNLKAAFGAEPGNKWSEGHLEVMLPNGSASRGNWRMVSIVAAGMTGQLRGLNLDDYRPDLIVCDDPQTEESVGTPLQRAKTNSLIFGSLYNTLISHTENPHAKMVLAQTPMEHDDAIDRVKKNRLWTTRSYSVFDSRGESRWPDLKPTDTLKRQKEEAIRMGEYSIWMREQEVTLVKSEHRTFDVKNIRTFTDPPALRSDCVISIDPASSNSKKAAESVVLTAMRSGPDVYVLDYSAERGEMPDATANNFFQQAVKWKPRRVRVETNAYQKVLAWYLKKEMTSRRLFYTINEVTTREDKSDKIIQALAGLVANGHLYLRPNMTKLMDQLAGFEPGSEGILVDVLDALSMAVMELDSPFDTGEEITAEFTRMAEEDDRLYGRAPVLQGAP